MGWNGHYGALAGRSRNVSFGAVKSGNPKPARGKLNRLALIVGFSSFKIGTAAVKLSVMRRIGLSVFIIFTLLAFVEFSNGQPSLQFPRHLLKKKSDVVIYKPLRAFGSTLVDFTEVVLGVLDPDPQSFGNPEGFRDMFYIEGTVAVDWEDKTIVIRTMGYACDGRIFGSRELWWMFELHRNFEPIGQRTTIINFPPRQQNLWVVSGSGSLPRV